MNPDTAKIIDRLVLSRDGLRKLDIADYAMIRDAREAMADAANALTNYAKTFSVIEQNDQAAAPHMLPAPEGVSEAEKHLAHIAQLLTPPDEDAIRILLSALSSERERAERAEQALEQFHEHKGWTANYVAQRLYDEKVAAEARAQAAEAKVKEGAELLGLTVEALEAARVFAQDAIEQNPTPSGVLGNLYGIRDAVDGAHAAEARMFIRHADHLTRQAALRWTEEASQGEGE